MLKKIELDKIPEKYNRSNKYDIELLDFAKTNADAAEIILDGHSKINSTLCGYRSAIKRLGIPYSVCVRGSRAFIVRKDG